MTKGMFYAVGVGPGDPELLTLKALRLIRQSDVIAVPDSGAGRRAALDIAGEYLAGKTVVECPMPMTRNRDVLEDRWRQAADRLALELDKGLQVAFLTLGDPSIYATAMYIHRLLTRRGYPTAMVPGVPSFCAAAAALNRPLCEGEQALHIVPGAGETVGEALDWPGCKVLMKSGSGLERLKKALLERGESRRAALVARCGMQGEQVFPSLEAPSGDVGYFALVIVKEEEAWAE